MFPSSYSVRMETFCRTVGLQSNGVVVMDRVVGDVGVVGVRWGGWGRWHGLGGWGGQGGWGGWGVWSGWGG